MPEPMLIEDACRKAPLESDVAVDDDLLLLRDLRQVLFELSDVDVVGALDVAILLPVVDVPDVKNPDRRVVQVLGEVGRGRGAVPLDLLALLEPGCKRCGLGDALSPAWGLINL